MAPRGISLARYFVCLGLLQCSLHINCQFTLYTLQRKRLPTSIFSNMSIALTISESLLTSNSAALIVTCFFPSGGTSIRSVKGLEKESGICHFSLTSSSIVLLSEDTFTYCADKLMNEQHKIYYVKIDLEETINKSIT